MTRRKLFSSLFAFAGATACAPILKLWPKRQEIHIYRWAGRSIVNARITELNARLNGEFLRNPRQRMIFRLNARGEQETRVEKY